MIEDQAIAAEGADTYYSRYHDAETRFLRRMSSWLAIQQGQGPSDSSTRSSVCSQETRRRKPSRVLMP